jgi:hypothetical protein
VKIKRNWGIVRYSVAALTVTLALADTNVAGATAASPSPVERPVPAVSQTVSALETSMKWRSNSFSVAGSRVWSKLFVFTSTSINVRLPIN